MTKKKVTTSARALAQVEQDGLIIQLRIAGVTLEQIGIQTGGQSAVAVHKKIKRIMRQRKLEVGEDYDNMRDIQNVRYERMIQSLWPAALRGALASVDRLTRILSQQAKLYGLDAPTKIAQTTATGQDVAITMSDDELDARIAELKLKISE